MNILLAVLLVVALLLAVHSTLQSGVCVIRGEVPAYGPTRQLVIVGIARRAASQLDRDMEELTRK